MNGIRVSVLIVAYQAEEFIKETVGSVLAQTYSPFEIIVVNDGSTDKTGEIVSSFSSVRCVASEHKGIASARNLAVKEAKGDYVAFLDADDIWVPSKLEKQVRYISDNENCQIVFSHYENFTDIPLDSLTERQKKVMENLSYPYLASALISRNVFEKYGLFDEKYTYGEDTEWLKRLQFAGLDLSHEIPEVLYRRRIHGANITLSHQTPGQKEMLSLMADAIRKANQIKSGLGDKNE
ncbi:glycosyltransferase family 2 protein [Butyrivibrio sp. AE2032]|uniref:glycosyltransferase family 2 protein n=1 Tax=Butyrivibrio sp. AE2032 TaxID=1458463 RepID=UPI00068E3977|nr:glycosyltransferase family A protein [Butyrivibrio sp. AE2032]